MSDNIITLTVESGENIPSPDLLSDCDSYIKFTWNNQKYKSKVFENQNSPQWNSKFQLVYDPDTGPFQLEIQVWDSNTFSPNREIGKLAIDFREFEPGKEHQVTKVLNTLSSKSNQQSVKKPLVCMKVIVNGGYSEKHRKYNLSTNGNNGNYGPKLQKPSAPIFFEDQNSMNNMQPDYSYRPSGQYSPPSNQYNQPPSQYPPPANQYSPPANQYPPPASHYPPPVGQYPPATGQYPPATGQYPPPTGQYPPPTGQYPPPSGQYPPPTGQYPPPGGQYPPPGGHYPPPGGQYPPPGGQYPPSGHYPPPAGQYPPPMQPHSSFKEPYGQPTGNYPPPITYIPPQFAGFMGPSNGYRQNDVYRYQALFPTVPPHDIQKVINKCGGNEAEIMKKLTKKAHKKKK